MLPTWTALLALALPGVLASERPTLELRDGDTVAVVGGTLVERMASFGYFETLLRGAHPELELRVRCLGWSGDTVSLRPRPLNFGDLHDHLGRIEADVVVLCYGGVEAFDGEAGLPAFRDGLAALVEELRASRQGDEAPRLALVSPIACEDLGDPLPPADERNRLIALYTDAVRSVADGGALPFVDLFAPSLRLYAEAGATPLTINGLHLNAEGAKRLAPALLAGLAGASASWDDAAEETRALVVAKNREWFLRWRPVNGEYVFGRRAEPFGVVSFPPEMEVLDERVAALDRRIGESVRAATPPGSGDESVR